MMKNKNIVVMGAGVSGIAAAEVAVKRGARVIISEMTSRAKWTVQADRLERSGVTIEAGGHQKASFEAADLVVVSPGISKEHPLIEEALGRGIPCISEIEWAYRCLPSGVKIIGITGTKGKTTTTTLVGELVKAAGYPVVVAGNIGSPLSGQVDRVLPSHFVVLELSSFQLELIESFRPHLAVVLNISEDHLDRHKTMQSYIEAKLNIFKNQENGDLAILNLDNRYTPLLQEATQASTVMFSRYSAPGAPGAESSANGRERTPARGVWVRRGVITTNLISSSPAEARPAPGRPAGILDEKELLIRGPHNVENAMAAVAAAALAGVSPGVMASVLRSFRGVPHRQEFVGTVKGVQFINNSQGTNIDAVAKSLQSYDHPIVLIAGGRSKGARFEELNPLLKERVKAALVIGEAASEIEQAWGSTIPVVRAESMESAVKGGLDRAEPGDVVLLSPACTSFDMFKNYEDRGDKFRRAVEGLARRYSASGAPSATSPASGGNNPQVRASVGR